LAKNKRIADILSIGITHDKKDIIFQLKTADKIDSQYRYTLHIILYGFAGPFKKISISYENGKVTMGTAGSHTLKYTVKDKEITYRVPKNYFPDISHIFLQGTTGNKDQKIDDTQWRMIQLY
jgi:hypothetical protein